MKYIEKELVPFRKETMCFSEATEVINETQVKILPPLIVQEKHLYKIPASIDNNFKHISVIRIEEA